MLAQPFKIYSSSAGSGKTYTLTKEYLKLALQHDNPNYFRHILAITFTNDAASEMKERILLALKGFVNENDLPESKRGGNRQLLRSVIEELNQYTDPEERITAEIVQKRARRIFANILHDYSDFAVSTIDSFVNRLVSAFTEELDVPFNYEVDLETADLLDNAVDRLLNRIGAAEEVLLSQTLEEYALEKADEGQSWGSLPLDLSGFGMQLLNEKVYGAVTKLKDLTLKDFRELRENLTGALELLKGEIGALADTALHLIEQNGLDSTHFSGGRNGIFGYFEKLVESPERNLDKDPSATIQKAVYGDEWTPAKIKEDKRHAVQNISSQLAGYFDRIEKLKGEWMLLGSILKHFYKLSVIHEINRELARVKTEKNAIHISDFNKAIINIVLQEPVPFIYERLGERYNHILIDEFQDTSVLQWNNLLPLVENGLAKGHFSLVVGDAKQAIYGWRGGDMEQIVFLSQKRFPELIARHDHHDVLSMRYETFDYALQLERLNTNYRSAAEIVQFNNQLFRLLTDKYGHDKQLLADVYDVYAAQEMPAQSPKTGGRIAVEFIEKTDAEDAKVIPSKYQSATFMAILQKIGEAQAAGYSLSDIAVLNRSNRNGKLIANFLKENHIPVISQDSLLLQHSPAVSLVIAFFRVLYQPGDALLRYEALHLFHREIRGDVPIFTTEEQQNITESLSFNPFFAYLEEKGYSLKPYRLLRVGLYELAEKIIQTFDLLTQAGQSAYLFRFLDVVLQFSTKESNHLADFMEYWERKKESICINIPEGQEAVTVTSIHKSKGLEYPVVIVPFAEWSLEPGTRDTFWLSLEPEMLNWETQHLHKFPLKAAAVTSKNLARTPLRNQFKQAADTIFIENLNMLYVALTRPTDRLYLIARLDEFEKPRGESVNYLLYQYLNDLGLWEPERKGYVLTEGLSNQTKADPLAAENVLWLDNPAGGDWQDKTRLRRLAASLFNVDAYGKKNDLNQRLCTALTKLDSTTDLPDCLERMRLEGAIDDEEQATMQQNLTELLQHHLLQPHFSQSAKNKPSRDIVCRKTLNLQLPDRVITNGRKATIMNFVPGKIGEAKQKVLHQYAKHLQDMGFSEVEKLMVSTGEKNVVVV